MSDRALIQCDQCGQTDDHPKVNFLGGSTKHHDCLSVAEERDARASDVVAQVIDACKDGKRGDELLAHIETLEA